MHCACLWTDRLNHFQHSPPCGIGKDVTSIYNNLEDDNQGQHNTTNFKSRGQHRLDSDLRQRDVPKRPTKSRWNQPDRDLSCLATFN